MKRTRLAKIVGGCFSVLGGAVGDFPAMNGINMKLSKLRSMGVQTIIDVRISVQNCAELSGLCRKYGVEYFYYPYDGSPSGLLSSNDDTVRLFPKLCQLIEAGGYYLCGRGEAILTLMLYWIFYGADKGLGFCQVIKEEERNYDCHCLPYYEDKLYGNFSRVSDRMLERFSEYGQKPLNRDAFSLRYKRIWRRPWWECCSTNELEGQYSFLTISKGSRYGVYRVSIENNCLGRIEEPNRECAYWRYNYVYEGNRLSGEASSFGDARKVLFDYIFSHITPEEYYKLMKLNG